MNTRRQRNLRWPLAIGLGASLCSVACSYDLDRLRGVHDAQVDDRIDTAPPDGAPVDDAPDAQERDAVDVPGDTGPTCTDPTVLDVRTFGSQFGSTWRVTGDTNGGPSVLSPPDMCTTSSGGAATSERVYRYVVQQGPRLYATTDSLAACGGSFDTILYALAACADATTALGCDDDDHVLTRCDAVAGFTSSILLDGLRPGQPVYLVVDGFDGHTGQFSLSVTENGLQNAVLPSLPPVGVPTTRCGCPGSTDNVVQTLPFPSPDDRARSAVGGSIASLSHEGDRLGGSHSIPALARVAGAALEFTLAMNGLSCNTGVATFDLLVGGSAVQSFEIDARAPTLTPQHVSYATFGALIVSNTAQIELRLRSVGDCTGGVVFMPNGTLTLVGH